MRIALVTETFYPAIDGTTTTVKAVADRLIDTGHEVMVIAPAPGLASYRSSSVARIRALDRPGRQVREALERFAPDLVHVTSPGAVGRKALKQDRLGIPALVVEQSPLLDVAADYWRTRVADRADAVVVTSRWMVDRLAYFEVAAGLWAPGVDTAAFTPALRDDWLHDRWSRARSRTGGLVVVGYVGSLRKRHDVRRLAALARVPGIRPVVVGDGPQRAWLEGRLHGARFTGALGTGDLTAVLPSLDLLVHPGEHETCCHPLREAGASGVPVVAPRAGGAPDVVRHLESGLLYDPADEHGLARAVSAVAADRHRSLLGARGRELAVRDWTSAVDELVERHYLPLVVPTKATVQ
ncbi:MULTISPECIES: glycosyltransferase [unclassified Nocardioides]|uniref:glycosyltransferase n=1 Tax=unclassified Nocardioides TaxID=2615069 RepID=UPI0009F07454|nr:MULTISPECIES: glycosyltransferase [unclassified Nocardioides]GAW50490.1 group 1 glycosyl transferase [Nocardioides sp. PD653-B2]GAW55160.1 group 1 glycosyl transferase [Nocardioides sp. PD653]